MVEILCTLSVLWCFLIIRVYSLLVPNIASFKINKLPLIEQVLSHISRDELTEVCTDDIYNVTKWKTDYIDILHAHHAIVSEECTEMDLSQDCFDDCIYYNDPASWILLIIENTTESLNRLNRMITFYTMSAGGEYNYHDVGNPDMCIVGEGTYCSTPAVFQNNVFMQHGCCVPGSCVGHEAVQVLQSNVYCYESYANQYLGFVQQICEPIARDFNSVGPIIVITIFFIFVLLVIIASIIKQYYKEYDNINNNQHNIFVSSFNFQDIWTSFIGTRPNNKSQFNFLDGIRVWSMSWVIYGHSWQRWFGSTNAGIFIPQQTGNSKYKYLVSYFYMIFAQYGVYSVDSFFWLSGLLGAFSIYRQTKTYRQTNKSLSWFYLWMPLAYLARILRIAPMMYYVTAIEWQLADQLPYGYQVVTRNRYSQICDDNWDKVFLFYQNLDDDALGCMGELWYIYNDMQMYLLLPILVLAFHINKLFGLFASLIPIIVCLSIRFYYAFYYDFVANEMYPQYASKNGGSQKFDSYQKPWTRMGPFFVGTFTMFAFIILEERYPEFRLSRMRYFASLFLGLFILGCLVIWPFQDVVNAPHDRWSLLSNQIYYALCRPSWGIGLSLLAFSFRFMSDTNNQKSIIKQFLSFQIYQSIGKLTYLMYLVHMIILMWWLRDLSLPQYYTLWNQVLLCIAAWFIVSVLSLILWLFMEKPLSNLCVIFIKFIQKQALKLNNKMICNNHEEALIKKSMEEANEATNYNMYDAEQSMKYSVTQQNKTSFN
eukprot:168277_1